jgi:hypothetical protein
MFFQGPDDMDADTFVAHDDVAKPQNQRLFSVRRHLHLASPSIPEISSPRVIQVPIVIYYFFSSGLCTRSNFHPPTIEEIVPRPSM